MNKVFIIQAQPGKNLVPAIKYGELVTLLNPQDQIIINSERAVKLIGDKLALFDDDDFLLLIGDPAAILIAGVMAAKVNNGIVNVLKWDRQTSEYYPVKIDFNKYEINFNRKVR
jgi:hypothetical protein